MENHIKKISAVVPSFNGLNLFKQNLTSLLTSLRNDDELVIIDDASTDQSVDWLINKFNAKISEYADEYQDWGELYQGSYKLKDKKISVKIFINKNNQRFAESCNRGVKLASGEIILLINNDVSPEKGLIETVLPYFSDRINQKLEKYQIIAGQVFAVGCMEVEANLGGIKGGKNKLWFEKGRFFHSRADNYKTGSTAWASGGSAFFDRQKWLRLDGFDIDYYPAYWEDVDLSFRAKKQGWIVFFEETAIVNHNHESTNQTAFGQKEIKKISWKNGNKFVMKNGNFWQKLSFYLWLPYWIFKRLFS